MLRYICNMVKVVNCLLYLHKEKPTLTVGSILRMVFISRFIIFFNVVVAFFFLIVLCNHSPVTF